MNDLQTTTADLLPVPSQRPDENPALVYLARLGQGSRRTMKRALDTIADLLTSGRVDAVTLPWGHLRYQHTSAVRSALQSKFSAPATANKHLAALRGVLREAWRLGQMAAEEFHRAVDLKAVRGETLPAGRSLNAGEIRAIFAACQRDSSPAGARDAAILALSYGGGIRRSEVANLDLADYDPATGAIKIQRGKGSKARLVYATNGARDALDAWLAHRAAEKGPLFCRMRRGGHVTTEGLSAQAVYLVCRKRASEAGTETFSPHDLRRTFIGDLLDAGADIVTVQKLAGHANVQTTSRYDRRPEDAKRKAAELLHVPYRIGG